MKRNSLRPLSLPTVNSRRHFILETAVDRLLPLDRPDAG